MSVKKKGVCNASQMQKDNQQMRKTVCVDYSNRMLQLIEGVTSAGAVTAQH